MILNEFFNLPQVFEKDMTEDTGQDSKSWMASIRQQHPDVKFIQAKMPGAPIIALVNSKPVAQFDTKKDVEEGTEETPFGSVSHNDTPVKPQQYHYGTEPSDKEIRKQRLLNVRQRKQDLLRDYAQMGALRVELIHGINNDVFLTKDQLLDYFDHLVDDPELTPLEYAHENGIPTDGLLKGMLRRAAQLGVSALDVRKLFASAKAKQGVAEGMFGSKPSPVLPIVAKIDRVARELTPQNVETGKQIIQSHTRDITRMLSPQTKAGVDVIEQGINENSDVLAGLTDILKIAASRQTPQNPRYFAQQVKDVALQLKDNPATQKWSNYLDGVVKWADVISSGKEQYSPGFADEVHSVLGPATRAYQDALLNKQGVAEGNLTELSPDTLASYKKKAGADASAADKRGDIERGNKRFSGIVKATIKQGEQDAKQHPKAPVRESRKELLKQIIQS